MRHKFPVINKAGAPVAVEFGSNEVTAALRINTCKAPDVKGVAFFNVFFNVKQTTSVISAYCNGVRSTPSAFQNDQRQR